MPGPHSPIHPPHLWVPIGGSVLPTFSQVLIVSALHQVKVDPAGLPHHLRDGALFSFPIVLLVCGYMLTNKLVFGTFTPVSGQVKTWWGTLENTVYRQNTTLVGLMGLAPGRGKSPWSLLTSIVADISIFIRTHLKNALSRIRIQAS